ncbi:MAG TPA: histidine phosphatase family protein [Anaerovoracaceae bacterium]|nr:histidine phosphatase family protein [Anaerovoracaceae bacterium]
MESANKNTESGDHYVGLILAAGYSSRMGAFKPLLQIGDMTAVERVSAALKKAGVNKIIGVTGFLRRRLVPVFASEGIIEAYNPDFEQGMFTSIKTGLRTAVTGSEAPEGFFLMPVDCPLVPPVVIRQIAEKHKEDPEAFIVPCFRGKKGHPLFIPVKYTEEILSYGGEGGLKAVTDRHEDRLIRLEVGTEAVVLDMDTRSGYEEVLEYYERQQKETGGTGAVERDGNALEEALRGKRLFLIRHGEIRQHREKILLGQTDVPLSETGKKQAADAAEELKRYGVSVKRIYTSDLSRAAGTAEIIRDRLYGRRIEEARGKEISEPEVILEPRFREMSLGEWDGRFISEIREKYPEEYQKRGENLLNWKYGNDSENFYDLQYRVMKGFRDVLEKERTGPAAGPSDIVIVSHSGVINVIVSNLRQMELARQIGSHIPNGGVVLIDFTKG